MSGTPDGRASEGLGPVGRQPARVRAETLLDTEFNVESDSGGRDPDSASPTLRRYHQMLWSKPLPDGTFFSLDASSLQGYLLHESRRGRFSLASDSIVHSYRGAYKHRIGMLMANVPAAHADQVHREGSSIGGYVVFPADVRDRKPTINGARGMHPRICDRFDLTLECIRRHYARLDSPLSAALSRYADFFDLFEDFGGYVGFFLLEDLIDADGSIRWYLPFDDFRRSPLPQSLDEYERYRQAVLTFVRYRNRRMAAWVVKTHPQPDAP